MRFASAMRVLWTHHKPSLLMLAAALLAAFIFAGQFLGHHRDWRGRPPEPQVVEPWMTIRFVSHAYHLKPQEIREILGFEDPAKKLSFEEIAARQGRSVEDLLQDLNAALEMRRPQPPPPPPAPAPAPQARP